MNFAQDMQAMTPAQVQLAVEGRLLRGEGMPWHSSQGEPVWGLLQDAFKIWRQQADLLQAFDQGLNTVITQSLRDDHWTALEAGVELALALLFAPTPWQSSHLPNWPLEQCLNQSPQSLEQAWAMGAVLKLAMQLSPIQPLWCLDRIRAQADWVAKAARDPLAQQQSAHLFWLTSLWSALMRHADYKGPLPWADVWRAHAQVKSSAEREHSLDVVLAEARERINAEELRRAVNTLRMTKNKEFKPAVLGLMPYHWPTQGQSITACIEDEGSRDNEIEIYPDLRNLMAAYSARTSRVGQHPTQPLRPYRRSEPCPA